MLAAITMASPKPVWTLMLRMSVRRAAAGATSRSAGAKRYRLTTANANRTPNRASLASAISP